MFFLCRNLKTKLNHVKPVSNKYERCNDSAILFILFCILFGFVCVCARAFVRACVCVFIFLLFLLLYLFLFFLFVIFVLFRSFVISSFPFLSLFLVCSMETKILYFYLLCLIICIPFLKAHSHISIFSVTICFHA